MKNRSRMEISAAILELAQGGAIKTRIMYEAILSFDQVQKYFELLIDLGLMEYDKEERKYHTTEKGKRFVKAYREMEGLFHPSRITKKMNKNEK